MAAISPNPFMMQDVILTLGANSYEATVSSATLTPANSTTTWKGLKKGSTFTFASFATWSLDLDYAQDFTALTTLSNYAFDHEGEDIAFELRPKGTGTSGFSGTCILSPGAIGGAVDGVATATASFPVKGKPTRVV